MSFTGFFHDRLLAQPVALLDDDLGHFQVRFLFKEHPSAILHSHVVSFEIFLSRSN